MHTWLACVRSPSLNLIVVASVVGVILALISVPVFFIVWRGFNDVQHDEVELEMVRFLDQIEAVADRNELVAKSWGAWDSLYDYAGAFVSAFASDKLSAAALTRERVDLYAFIDTSGRVVRAGVRPPVEGAPLTSVPEFTNGQAPPDFAPIGRALAGEVARSRERVDDELMLLAAAPIQDSARLAPSRGAIVIGRRVDARLIEALGERLRTQVKATPLAGDEGATAIAARLVPGEIAVQGVGVWSAGEHLVARTVLTDTSGAPAVLLALQSRRQVLDQARSSMELAGVVMLLCLTSFIVIAIWLSQRFALVQRGSLFTQAMGDGTMVDGFDDVERSTLLDRYSSSQPVEMPVNVGGDLMRDRIRVLYRNEFTAVGFNILAVLAVSAYLIGKLPFTWLVAWAAVALSVNLAQLLHIRWRRAQRGFPINARRAGNECAIGATISGLSIGIGFFLFADRIELADQATVALVTLGLCSGAAASKATYRPAFLGYVLGAMSPLVVRYFLRALEQSSMDPFITGLMIVVFGLFSFMVHGYISESMGESLKLRYEKDDLLNQMSQDRKRIAADRDAYRHASLTDGLTGIANRRSFDEALTKEWNRAQRSKAPMSCLLLDIDFFKLYNDALGHDQGDECLRKVASVINRELGRGGDFAARYGGEEFAGVMPETDANGALAVAERVRAAVEAMAEPHPDSPVNECVTVSIGVATTSPTRESPPAILIKLADTALYEAKESGRNRALSAVMEPVPVESAGGGNEAA